MRTNDTKADKTGGPNAKPATVDLDDGTVIEATHHIRAESDGAVHLYLNDRRDGIDVTIPAAAGVRAIARSDAGRAALGIDTDTDGSESRETRVVTDGGTTASHARSDGVDADSDGVTADSRRTGECVRDDCTNDVDIHGIGLDAHCSPYCVAATAASDGEPGIETAAETYNADREEWI